MSDSSSSLQAAPGGPPAGATANAPRGTTRELVTLAWPLVLSNLAYTAVGFTDTLYMGRLGVVEVGAVGLASLMLFTVSLLFRGMLNTAATFVARALGASDPHGIQRWAGVFLTLSLIGLPLVIVGPWVVSVALNLLQADAAISGVAHEYARIRIYELPFVLLGTASLGIMLGLGNTRTPMVLSWLLVVVNAALAGLFVFALHWGVVGAAWGTLIAVAMQGLLAFVLLLRLYRGEYRMWFVKPTAQEMRAVGRISLPAGATELADVGAFTTFLGVIARLGPTELAASQIANQFASFGFLPAFALSASTSSLLSRAMGAGQPALARRIGWRGAGLAMGLMLVLTVVFLLFPRQLIELFNHDPEVLKLGTTVLAVMSGYMLLDGVGIVLGGALGGAGDTRFRLLVTIGGAWLLMVPAAIWLAPRYGVGGAWCAALLYIAVMASLYAWRFWSGRWVRARL
ncbi:MATE family efflux transporter [Deinococcus irradiatisoli]|uniref:Multidrug-efflux transporter n=1 Tax=Deinococcus irradiatisoli TaxID=2202254 RepID=A0A2Z3JG74_9DEIO|nr:MATE family efflux transporter [Deinococcus irradiatisoli]AWN23965.1 MATE family efflux transporter [Deinococcus irradiatisoli]